MIAAEAAKAISQTLGVIGVEMVPRRVVCP
jgi:hypothetical protein